MNIDDYLRSCRELSTLCSQNGWIDNDTLAVEVLEQDDHSVLAAVTFEEILVEGAGCVAGRVPCHGRVQIRLTETGDVESLVVL